jgi:hypothetical protein
MNIRVFLMRLAIAFSIPSFILFAVSAIYSKSADDFTIPYLIGMGWLAFVWLCYWVLAGLFAPKK